MSADPSIPVFDLLEETERQAVVSAIKRWRRSVENRLNRVMSDKEHTEALHRIIRVLTQELQTLEGSSAAARRIYMREYMRRRRAEKKHES